MIFKSNFVTKRILKIIFNIENKIELISNIFDDYEIDVELYDDKKDMQNTLVSFRDLKKFKTFA